MARENRREPPGPSYGAGQHPPPEERTKEEPIACFQHASLPLKVKSLPLNRMSPLLQLGREGAEVPGNPSSVRGVGI